jgi:hypothetical protein
VECIEVFRGFADERLTLVELINLQALEEGRESVPEDYIKAGQEIAVVFHKDRAKGIPRR